MSLKIINIKEDMCGVITTPFKCNCHGKLIKGKYYK